MTAHNLSSRGQSPNLPRVRLFHICTAAAIGLAACGSEPPQNPVRQAFAEAPKTVGGGAAAALRFPARGSTVRLYRLPTLDEASWQFDARRQPTARFVGFASDADLVLSLVQGTATGYDLVALDLITGRSRTLDSSVALATLGPTGTGYLVRTDGTVAEVEGRSVLQWPDTLEGVTQLFGAARERIVAIVETESDREVVLLARGQAPIRHAIPKGPVAVSQWGRLVTVATDSGLVFVLPQEPDDDGSFLRLEPAPRLLAMSPSGHRIYTVLGDTELAVVGRFGENLIERKELLETGRISALRPDPLGRILLVQVDGDEGVWIVDAATLAVRATVSGTWEDDLPAVAPDGTVLLRRESRLVALDKESYEIRATTATERGDKWLIAAWDPRRPALELTAESAVTDQPGQLIYVQVSSSGNPAWADDLAQELHAAGLNATVLPPDSTEERYRVVLGPYPTREEAEENGRRLGRPFWILIRDATPQIQ